MDLRNEAAHSMRNFDGIGLNKLLLEIGFFKSLSTALITTLNRVLPKPQADLA
jgi:hypothetical protein